MLQLESACTELLRETAFESSESYRPYLDQMVRALEKHGDESYFVVDTAGSRPKAIDVLALDLAWLAPGPFGGWSEQGTQAYCWRVNDSSKSTTGRSWYQRALKTFFTGRDASSLLSLPDTYIREARVHWDWISEAEPAGSKRRRGRGRSRPRLGRLGFNAGPFQPRYDVVQTPTAWEARFKTYKDSLGSEMQKEFGKAVLQGAVLVWVYLSPGNPKEDNQPPNWGVSLFTVLRLANTKSPKLQTGLGSLVSNIYNSLKSAAQKALEAKREQRNLAQALSHEFKNLNQGVVNLAYSVRNELTRLPPSVRKEMVRIESRLEALHLAAQATTSLCLGTYWLFSTKDPSTTVKPDKNCRVFRHIMYLAIRLIAQSMPSWRLVGIPTESEILKFLRNHFDLPPGGELADVVLDPPLAVMLFLALEPVRNIRGKTAEQTVYVSLAASTDTVTLTQTTTEREPPGSSELKSYAVANLMQALDDYCPWDLVQVDPWTSIVSFATKNPGELRITKTTKIKVSNIIHRIPSNRMIERRQ